MAIVEVVMDSTESIYTKSCRSTIRKPIFIGMGLLLVALLTIVALIYASAHRGPGNDISHAEALISSNPGANTIDGNVKPNCPGANGNLCLTEGCVKAAALILEKINQTVEPCDDFYQFVCGKFLQETEIPDEDVSVTTFNAIYDKVQMQLRFVLNQPATADDIRPVAIAKQFNRACLDVKGMEVEGLAPLKRLIDSYGGWPVVVGGTWNDSDWHWYEVVGKALNDGFKCNAIMQLGVTTDLRNSSTRVLDLDQPDLDLNREFLMQNSSENKIVKAYFNFMTEVATLFGADETIAQTELLDALEFEKKLANITLPEEKRRNSTLFYNRHTINHIQATFPYLPWLKVLNAMLPDDLLVDGNEYVIVDVPDYLNSLETILAETSKRTIANFCIWRIVYQATSFLTEELRQLRSAYDKIVYGTKVQLPRWKQCVKSTSSMISTAVSAMYVRKYFDEDSKRRSTELMNNIRNEFLHILHYVSWMDEVTLKAALDKANAMQNHIGYPDELLDDKKLTDFYESLPIGSNSMFLNVLSVHRFKRNFDFKLLREPVNQTDWRKHAFSSMVNAMYSPAENSIQIPAAILQGTFFSPDQPRYLNYAAIGQIIAHEITHGFDDQGRQFDLHGNLVDWWNPDTEKKFLEKSQCIIEQYGNYTDLETGLKLNGINTQGENIADNGAVKEAYAAYERWANREGPEPTLPGLNYSPKQLFWISLAQTWCGKLRKEYKTVLITTDVHAVYEFRAIGPLRNSHDFARDFNCPFGSKMNPVKKCEVW